MYSRSPTVMVVLVGMFWEMELFEDLAPLMFFDYFCCLSEDIVVDFGDFEGLGFKEEEAFFRKVEKDELREKLEIFVKRERKMTNVIYNAEPMRLTGYALLG